MENPETLRQKLNPEALPADVKPVKPAAPPVPDSEPGPAAPENEGTDVPGEPCAVPQEAAHPVSDYADSFAGLYERLDSIEAGQKAIAQAVRTAGETPVQPSSAPDDTASLNAEMQELKTQNMTVLRELMNFVQVNRRQMNEELTRYHRMFENSAHDNIWKSLGEIYRSLCKLAADGDQELAEDLEWDALEPMRDLMEEFGVTVQESKPGEKRSLKRTHVKKQTPTGDPEMNGLVVRSLKPGFVRDDTVVLISEEVETYVFDPSLAEKTEPGPAEPTEAAPVEKPADVSAEPTGEKSADVPAEPTGEKPADVPAEPAGTDVSEAAQPADASEPDADGSDTAE